MTKLSFDPEQEEAQITRSIGKSGDGKITINREGGGAIEINLGIASFGLTTDYGGAISLGIAGQEITWGREGGTIHLEAGGFAVDVEARDCIVTEIKSIFGHIVAQRSYPDPGCKLPDPDPFPTPLPLVSSDPEKEIVLPKGEVGWTFYTMKLLPGEPDFWDGNYYNKIWTKTSASVDYDDTLDASILLPFGVRLRDERRGAFSNIGEGTLPKRSPDWRAPISLTFNGKTARAIELWSTMYLNGREYQGAPLQILRGTTESAKEFIELTNSYERSKREINPKADIWFLIPTEFIPFESKIPKSSLLPTGNKPPMRDCCEEILDYLADFEEAFDIKRLLKDKFPVSNVFMAPECDPASVTKAKSFYEIMQCSFRMMAHGMIFEPRVNIKDADAAKAGDQEFKARYLNATGWASAVSEALMEVKDDGNVATNMDIRSGFAATQLMVGVADAIYKLDAILDCFGVELAHEIQTVETPYNLMIRLGKGFGENNERQLDLNKDEATEALLPQLLQTKKNKIKTVIIHPRSRTVHEMLESIESAIARISNG
jgi:hypothetical protein